MSDVSQENVTKTYTDPITGKFVTGNPGGGRPKGSKSFETIYRDALRVIADTNGTDLDTVERELVETAIKKAKEGDYRFYQDIMDRLNGKPVQRSENVNANVDVNKLEQAEKDKLKELLHG